MRCGDAHSTCKGTWSEEHRRFECFLCFACCWPCLSATMKDWGVHEEGRAANILKPLGRLD
eukprot:2457160-Rhodomonas_salina.2